MRRIKTTMVYWNNKSRAAGLLRDAPETCTQGSGRRDGSIKE